MMFFWLEDLLGAAQALPVGARHDAVGHRGLVQQPEVAAFEGAAKDLADDRHAELPQLGLVEQVLALAHRLAEAADQRALGQAGAEIAGVDHVGQLGVGLHEHDLDAGLAVGCDELAVLAAKGRQVGLLAARQHAAGDLVDGLED